MKGKGREGKGREGKGREGREGKGREGKGREGKGIKVKNDERKGCRGRRRGEEGAVFTHTLTVLTCFGSHSRWCLWVLCNVVYCSRRELVGGKCTGRKTGNRLLNSVLTKIHRPKATHLRLHRGFFQGGGRHLPPSPPSGFGLLPP